MTDSYAHGFSTIPGRCFRFTTAGVGSSTLCREPIVVSGRWRDSHGQLWLVQACRLHIDNLEEVEAEGGRFV